MRKDSWIFIVKLLIASVGLGLIWYYYFQQVYPSLIQPIFEPLFNWLDVRRWRLYQLLDHFTNIATYTALILATPGIVKDYKKSLSALFGGLAILVAGHFFLSWIDYYYVSQYGESRAFFRSAFHFYILNDAFPFILWLIFYHETFLKLFPFLNFNRPSKKA